jgi:hypothetical protein
MRACVVLVPVKVKTIFWPILQLASSFPARRLPPELILIQAAVTFLAYVS